MNTKDLIAKAKSLLEGTSPAPWKAQEWCDFDNDIDDRYGWCVDAANGNEIVSDLGDCSDQDRRLIEAAPNIIRELVEALEAAVATAELRYEWSQYYSEKYQEAKSLNERDPNEPR